MAESQACEKEKMTKATRGDNYPGWLWVQDWDVSIGAAPKCGTRSILYALMSYFEPDIKYNSPEAVPSLWIKTGKMARYNFRRLPHYKVREVRDLGSLMVGVVRDPVERFCSLWRCQVRDQTPGIDGDEIITPSQLMDLIQDNPRGNVHWMHQHLFLDHAQMVVPIEWLSDWWKLYFVDRKSAPTELTIQNSTQGQVMVGDRLRTRVNKFYAQDREIYQEAISFAGIRFS